MTSTTLEELERPANAVREALAAAEADAARARAAAEERRVTAWRKHDEKLAARFDAAAHEADVAAAEEALRVAVLADPVHAAAVELYAARLRRTNAWRTAFGAAGRLGRTDDAGRWPDGPIELRNAGPVTADGVDAIVTAEATRLATAEQARVDQQRVQAGDRAAAKG